MATAQVSARTRKANWGLAGTASKRISIYPRDPHPPLTMEVDNKSPGKKKKDSPGKNDEVKKARHETDQDKHQELVALITQQIEMSKKNEQRLEEALKVQAAQTEKIDNIASELNTTRDQVKSMSTDMADHKDKFQIMEAKIQSVSEELKNIKRGQSSSSSPAWGRAPFTPGRGERQEATSPTASRAQTPTGQAPNARTPFSTPFNAQGQQNPFSRSPAQPSPTPSVSDGSFASAVNTVAFVRCFNEDTRKKEIVEYLRVLAQEVTPDLKPEEIYTPFKRCSFGCVKFASVSEMWQFIQKVNSAKRVNGSTDVRAKPRQSKEERLRDMTMNKFLRTLYRSSHAPPRDEVDADYRLGKIWVGRFLIAEHLRQGESPTIHEQEFKLALPGLDLAEFRVDFLKLLEGSE